MKRCLIVVDYQNDFVSGSLGFPGAVRLDARIAEKIEAYRAAGDIIVFTLDTHRADYLDTQEGKHLPVPHCIRDTEGHQLYGRVATLAQAADQRFIKYTFGSDDLYAYLKAAAFAGIELAGVVSNICVLSNAVLAKTAQPETPILVDGRCVASNDDHLNEAALDVMESLQIEVAHRRQA